MYKDIFKILSIDILPSSGTVLISEPFLCADIFSRSLILLVDHSADGSMCLVMIKQMPIYVNEVVKEFKYLEDIPLYKGGPIGVDTLFYLHTYADIPGSLQVAKGLYLNGDFNSIKKQMLQNGDYKGRIRFFIGYSGWEETQLNQEIEDNTWIIGKEEIKNLLSTETENMWKEVLCNQGNKYKAWARFPLIPLMN